MFFRTMIEILVVAALIVALYHEEKFVRFERDCRAIRRACKRQGITARSAAPANGRVLPRATCSKWCDRRRGNDKRRVGQGFGIAQEMVRRG